ncbi:TetR/AcrR family transcriptional regulator [Flavobacterium sp. LC2016-01]|uniref:TetR/AcrR family transcriptional regulator n=1 Tax=Flavobacterium sp. LC2016-01 TaxID=2675876 RepID=UPI0012BAD93B|nr:TetR/AcrR family transcriptional regulator [Flavobacterium sp. LC2016-01]MTH15834.1 TetR family transcriptional regulator [Flavobacterium sp. LC2016-01]
MSIAVRKLKEKENMRKLILDGARKVFLEKGYELTSMRNIAEAIDYSPSSIYFYFKEKGEIFHELHEEGFRVLLSSMQVLEHVSDPFERLKAMGHVFLDFAIHNKDFYNLMFIVDEPLKKKSEDDPWRMGVRTLDYLISVVRQCMETGRFKGMDAENLSFTILSSLHGMSALFCKDRTSTFKDKTSEELIEDGYKNLIFMLEKL